MGNWIETDIRVIMDAVGNGRSFTPGCYDARRSIDRWYCQRMIVLDFDGSIALTDVIDRCDTYHVFGDLMPVFAYTTFSAIDRDRFRVVWLLSQTIYDFRVMRVVQEMMYQLFPEADEKGKDLAHLFYGGREIIYENVEVRVDPEQLMLNACTYIQSTVANGNASRKIKGVFRGLGVKVVNGLPDGGMVSIENNPHASGEGKTVKGLEESETGDVIEGDDEFDPFLLSIKTAGSNSSSDVRHLVRQQQMRFEIHFVDGYTDEMARNGLLPSKTPGDKTEVRQPIVSDISGSIDKEESHRGPRRRPMVRDVDFHELMNRCTLLREFYNGKRWLYYPELRGLATNLIHLEGGEKTFFEGLESRPEYAKKIRAFRKAIDRIMIGSAVFSV